MGKGKKNLQKQVAVTEQLVAQNALDEALRLSQNDLFWGSQQASLSSLNGYKNIKVDVLSMQQLLLTYLYKTYGTLAKIVDVPVDDAYRNGGFELDADTIDEKEVKQLYDVFCEKDIFALKQARKWARLFGGAAIVALDGGDLDKPLNLANLKNLSFIAVDRWQLTYTKPYISEPDGEWHISNYGVFEDEGETIHPSRVKILHGKTAPFIIQQQTQGWGISSYEQIFQEMSQFFKARDVMFELIDEAKIDVLKLSTLQTALASDAGERSVQRMVDLIARNKNYKSQITLSTADEYEQKQVSMSGMADILKEIRVMIAGAANMPVNKLWGEGVTGFGSGEDSLENYNAQIENEIRSIDTDTIKWILKLRCYQLFNREVEDLIIDWKSLRVLSALDEQTMHDRQVANLMQLYDRQLLTPQELMEILKKRGILLHDTKALRGELEEMPMYSQEDSSSNNNNDQNDEERN